MKATHETLTRAYEALCEELNTALYEEDPASMGSNVGAPRDEYAAEAARLAVNVRSSSSRADVERELLKMFGVAPSPLLERVEKALAKFKMVAASAKDVEG